MNDAAQTNGGQISEFLLFVYVLTGGITGLYGNSVLGPDKIHISILPTSAYVYHVCSVTLAMR